MARIRSVKPELRRDLTVAEWPRECRYAWVLLFGYLDDHGRGLDDLRLLVADLFPLDRDVTERKLDGWLALMASPSPYGSAPLCRYEVAGRRFLHAPKWSRSQRVSHPQASVIPACNSHHVGGNQNGTSPDPVPNDSGTAPESFQTSRTPEDLGVKGAREQGSKGARVVAVDTGPPDTAQRLIATWLDHCSRRPPGAVIGQVGKLLAVMLAEGIDPDDVNRGLAAWQAKGLHPSALPSVVNEVMNANVRPITGRVAEGNAILLEAYNRGRSQQPELGA